MRACGNQAYAFCKIHLDDETGGMQLRVCRVCHVAQNPTAQTNKQTFQYGRQLVLHTGQK
jgi:hypothetical protein